MAWLEIHQAFPTHKKTLWVASVMKMTPESVAGHILKLWLWALDNAPDGYLPEDKDMLDACAGCPRDVLVTSYNCPLDVPSFTDVLIDKHYIDVTPEGWVLHDWDEYAGKLILARQAACERKRKERELKKTSIKPSAGHPRDVRVTSLATEQNNTVQNNTTCEGVNQCRELYQKYPRRIAYGQLEKAWKANQKEMPPFEELMVILDKCIAIWKAENRDITKIPYPASWLNSKPWMNDLQLPMIQPEIIDTRKQSLTGRRVQ